MAHSLTTIGLHLECAIQTEMVVELHGVSSNRMEAISSISAQIHHMQESYGKGSKVCQGQRSVELKIDKTQRKDR